MVIQNIRDLQAILVDLSDVFDTKRNHTAKQLGESIRATVIGVRKMISLEVEILRLQGKTVKKLFENAKLKVPPGFENL